MMMVVVQLWETLKETITAYTGLSPAAFFTVLALSFAVYHVVSGFFASPEEHRPRSSEVYPQQEPLPPPVQLGEITEEELKQYDGSDSKKPLLMAIKGQIYDVSQSRYAWEREIESRFSSALLIIAEIGGLRFIIQLYNFDFEYLHRFMDVEVKVYFVELITLCDAIFSMNILFLFNLLFFSWKLEQYH